MRWSRLLLLLVSATAGCGEAVTEPPSPDPGPRNIGPQPQPNPGRLVALRAEHVSAHEGAGRIELVGRAGAITSSTGSLWVGNISAAAPLARTAIAADGSFRVSIEGARQHLFRLQAESETYLSEPYDLALAAVGSDILLVRPSDCLGAGAPRQVGALVAPVGGRTSEAFSIDNTCDEPVRVQGIEVRSSGTFTVEGPVGDTVIGPGESVWFTAHFAPAAVGSDASVVVVRYATGAGRLAISLLGRTPDRP